MIDHHAPPMRAVVVDDEPHVRQAMAELLGRYCAGVEVARGCAAP